MLLITKECDFVAEMSLFYLDWKESMSLEQFESKQIKAIEETVKYLTINWIDNIVSAVRLCLSKIGKGWFDVEQKCYDVYTFMKLKRFMELVKQRMQV